MCTVMTLKTESIDLPIIHYQRYWYFNQPPDEVEGTLKDLILDIPHFFAGIGVIPSLSVLNQVLSNGGSKGGMGPGTKWVPFQITHQIYAKLVQSLLSMDIEREKGLHPYAYFETVVIDEELSQRDFSNLTPDELAQIGLEYMVDDPYWANHKQEQYWFRRVIQKYKKKPIS